MQAGTGALRKIWHMVCHFTGELSRFETKVMMKNLPSGLAAALSRLRSDASGGTAHEYALVTGIVALLAVAVASTAGQSIESLFDNISDAMSDVPEVPAQPDMP